MENITNKAGTSIGNAYKLISESPLDVRFVVATIGERNSIVNAHGCYPGLEVWVESEEKKYVAIYKTVVEDGEEKLKISWEEVPSKSNTYTK